MIQLSILSSLIILTASEFAFFTHCRLEEDVTITGYFTPIEAEYTAAPTIEVQTDSGEREYRKGFWDDLRIEWVGISERDGVVAIWDIDQRGRPEVFIDQEFPMDAQGGVLRPYTTATMFTPGTAASNHLEPGTIVRVIENRLAPLWTQPLYRVTDTIGGPNDEKHIDLYMGEGLTAKQKTETVTKLNGSGTLCIYQK